MAERPTDDPQERAGDVDRRRRLNSFAQRVGFAFGADTGLLDAATAKVLAEFERASIEVLLLKGRGLATLLYRPDEVRMYSDVDLLVAPDDFGLAQRALQRLGYGNGDSVRGIDDIGGVVHAQTWIGPVPPSTPTMLDLHRWFPGSKVAPDIAWHALAQHRIWIDVGGRRAAVLDRAGQAMHLATHAAQHGPTIGRHTGELRLGLERWSPEIWAAASTLATQLGADESFAAGLRLLPEGAELAAELNLPSTAKLSWTIEHRSERPRGTFHLEALSQASGRRAKMSIVRRSLFPQQEWIRYETKWASRAGRPGLVAAYALHLLRAPAWAARALWYRRRAPGRR